jgi:hypothetical protein
VIRVRSPADFVERRLLEVRELLEDSAAALGTLFGETATWALRSGSPEFEPDPEWDASC